MKNDKNKTLTGVFKIDKSLGDERHWNNSSNVLCNYMKEQRFLNLILKNSAIIPRYVIEPIEYIGIKEYRNLCFPMTCFCDIPFSKVSTHMSRYGEYGIGLDKNALVDNNCIQPIHYMSVNSPLIKDFKEAFETSMRVKFDGEALKLVNYLASTLMYMKPISGLEKDKDGNSYTYVYQDECEWRYIPSENFPENLHLILHPTETTIKGRDNYSKALESHQECWLKFKWDDVRYIIVPDNSAVKETISTIRSLNISNEEKDLLISKIEVSRHFAEDM